MINSSRTRNDYFGSVAALRARFRACTGFGRLDVASLASGHPPSGFGFRMAMPIAASQSPFIFTVTGCARFFLVTVTFMRRVYGRTRNLCLLGRDQVALL